MIERDCDNCGRRYKTKSEKSKFCTGVECKRERARLRRRKARDNVVEFPTPEDDGALTTAARQTLTEAKRVDTDAGRLVLLLAGRLDSAQRDTGASFSSLSREYRAAMAEALKGADAEDDPIARIRQGNEERRLSVVR